MEVPGYEAWAPGLPTERLQVTLDGLRQGELWLCKQFEVYAKAVECDMRARDSMLEDHARTIYDLQELVRTAGRTIDLLVDRDAQLQDMKDALLDSDRSLGRQVSDLQRLAGRMECQSFAAAFSCAECSQRKAVMDHPGLVGGHSGL